jgi:hypothetical protein
MAAWEGQLQCKKMAQAHPTPVRLYAKSLAYYDGEIQDEYISEESDTILLPERVWNKWIHHYEEGRPMLVDIRNEALGIERTVCIGPPTGNTTTLYGPTWLLNNIGYDYSDEFTVTVEPHLEEVAQATLLVLRPMDTAIYHSDVRDAFEAALDKFHVIQQGAMITVHIGALGGYEVSAYVERTEPEVLVRLGGEVKVEFIEPEGGVEEFVAAAEAAKAAEEAIRAAIEAANAKADAAKEPEEKPKEMTEEEKRTQKEAARLARLKYFEKKDN